MYARAVEAIAAESVLFAHADGTRTPGRIAVGAPYVSPEGRHLCHVLLEGLESSERRIEGSSTLQALCLALRYAAFILAGFQRDGGKVLIAEANEDGSHDEFPLDTYFRLGREQHD